MHKPLIAALALTACLLFTTPSFARDQIRAVGSSTVYPFATAVAEEYSKTATHKNIVVESTGTGGGFKLFCSGVGAEHPDIANASRRIKDSEFKQCQSNGVEEITEVKFGYDGIVLAQSSAAKPVKLTLQHIFLALAKTVPGSGENAGKMIANPYRNWNEIDPSLPAQKIEVYGPPPSSGTRDSFVELAMEGGCKSFSEIKSLQKSDEAAFKSLCHTIREDGAYVEAGENDNLIVQKLQSNPTAFGIFGYSFLDQNRSKLRAATINGHTADIASISGGKYPIAREMFFYVKNAHLDVIPGLKEFVAEFVSEKSFGDKGYLKNKGLIPLPVAERKSIREKALQNAPLAM